MRVALAVVLCVSGCASAPAPPPVVPAATLRVVAAPPPHETPREAAVRAGLRGDALMDHGDSAGALLAWLGIVCAGPVTATMPAPALRACTAPAGVTDDLLRAAWSRVAQALFDYDDPSRAEIGYARLLALTPPGDSAYDVVVYQHAWALFRADRRPEALVAFASVVTSAVNELHDESMQYVAILLADTDWDDDGLPDLRAGILRPEVQAFVRDYPTIADAAVLAAAHVAFDEANYRFSRRFLEWLLLRLPPGGRADEAKDLLVLSHDRERDR